MEDYKTCEYCSYDILDDNGDVMSHFCNDDHHLKVGTRVIIADNFDDHIGYIKGTIGTITEINDDGYYLLDIGHCVSEAEIDIV